MQVEQRGDDSACLIRRQKSAGVRGESARFGTAGAEARKRIEGAVRSTSKRQRWYSGRQALLKAESFALDAAARLTV
jgi:hypothetical protein